MGAGYVPAPQEFSAVGSVDRAAAVRNRKGCDPWPSR